MERGGDATRRTTLPDLGHELVNRNDLFRPDQQCREQRFNLPCTDGYESVLVAINNTQRSQYLVSHKSPQVNFIAITCSEMSPQVTVDDVTAGACEYQTYAG